MGEGSFFNPEAVRRCIVDRTEVKAESGMVCIGLADTIFVTTPEGASKLRDQLREALAACDVCEHGQPAGSWCEPCNREYKRAALEAFRWDDADDHGGA